MPWFYCDSCGDTIKKPKISAHCKYCAITTFTCIDCSATFDPVSVHSHFNCVTEKQKYIDGATKPGGFASNGYHQSSTPDQVPQVPEGIEFLTTHPPWRCNLCEIVCTSQKTLLAHAAGAPHRKKVKRQALIINPQKEEERSNVEKSEKSVTGSSVKKCEKSVTGSSVKKCEKSVTGSSVKKCEKSVTQSSVKKCEKSVTQSDVKKSEKRRIQKDLGLKVLRKHGPQITIKKFIKKFNKRTREQPELALDIIKRMRKLSNIEITDSVLHLKVPKE